jgi:hypothetical protein
MFVAVAIAIGYNPPIGAEVSTDTDSLGELHAILSILLLTGKNGLRMNMY